MKYLNIKEKYTWRVNKWELLFNDVIENDNGYFLV